MKPFVWSVIKGLLLTLFILLGLWLIHTGLQDIFQITGNDLVIPGDNVGELDIQQTRQIAIGWLGLLQLVIGLGIIGGAWVGLKQVEKRIEI